MKRTSILAVGIGLFFVFGSFAHAQEDREARIRELRECLAAALALSIEELQAALSIKAHQL